MRVSVVLLALVAGLLAVPATASAASCGLTSTAVAGHSITVTGTGFAANGTVDVQQVWSGSNATAGGNTGPQTTKGSVTADASGSFTWGIDAGPGRGGTYDITATDGTCTATTQAVAIETAGGLNPGGGTSGGTTTTSVTPPPTDTAPAATRTPAAPAFPVLPFLAIIALAAASLTLALRRRSGTGR